MTAGLGCGLEGEDVSRAATAELGGGDLSEAAVPGMRVGNVLCTTTAGLQGGAVSSSAFS